MAAAQARGRKQPMHDDDPVAPLDLRLVPAALGLWAGCLITLWGSTTAGFLAALLAVCAAVATLPARHRRWWRGMAVALICLAGGSLMCASRVQAATASPVYAAAARSAPAEIVVEIQSDPQPLAARTGSARVRYLVRGALLKATVGQREWPASLSITMFCDDAGWANVVPGQIVSTSGKLGIDVFEGWPTVSVNCSRAPVLISAEPWWQRISTRLRSSFAAVSAKLDGEAAGLLPGIVLGDRSRITPALTQDAKITGLTHLLAVSGSHFAVLCGAMLLLLRRAGPKVAAGGGLLFVVALVIVVRPSPSVLRAAVMGSLTLAALLLGRNRSILPALSTAVMVLLLVDPALAVEAGFALSVQATGAIVLLAPRWSEALQRRGWPAGWADLLVVPAVAQLGTMPVIAAISGTVSIWAVPANILVALAVPIALVLGAISALLSGFWPAGATILARLAAPAADWIGFCAHWVAGWPAAAITWPATTSGVLALAGVSVAIPLALRFRRLRVLAVAAIAGAAVVLIPTQVLSAGWPPADWLAVGCEVGQGDGFVVATGRAGEAVVIDTGPEPSVMDRCLDRLGVTSIPLVVLTHLHSDHIDGLPGVLRDRNVQQIGVGPGRDPPAAWGELLDESDAARVPVVSMDPGAEWVIGQLTVLVLGPDPLRVSRALGPNDQSVVVMIEVSGFRLLFPGDVEESSQQALLDSGVNLRADVLKLPHHGSAKLLPSFMAAVRPGVVMIGVGVGNDFGHPTDYALQLAATVGVQIILRTDTDGDIGVRLSDGVLGTATRGAAPIQPRRTGRRRIRPR